MGSPQLPDLAPGEEVWRYPRADLEVLPLLQDMAVCREPSCPVVERHPYYHAAVPVKPGDAAAKKAACMPVVPTRTARGKVAIIASFPTALFTARSRGNEPVSSTGPADDNHFEIPVSDIRTPLEGTPYFDGYKIRDVVTARILREDYLRAVGLDPDADIYWMTNLIKCFLFSEDQIAAYRLLGFDADFETPPQATRYDFLPRAGRICARKYLEREIGLCAPELIVTVGAHACAYAHGVFDDDANLSYDTYKEVSGTVFGRYRGAILEKDAEDPPPHPRVGMWRTYNMIHLYHPEAIARAKDDPTNDANARLLERHRESLVVLRDFLVRYGLVR